MFEIEDDSEIKTSKVAVNVELVPEYESEVAKSVADSKGGRMLNDSFY